MHTNKNVSESKRVRRTVRAKKQQCYKNAVRVIQKVPEYKNSRITWKGTPSLVGSSASNTAGSNRTAW